MKPDSRHLAFATLDGATKSGVISAAASIASGVALASTPVKILGLLTVATATSISWPLVITAGVSGAAAGGAATLIQERKRRRRIKEQFSALLED